MAKMVFAFQMVGFPIFVLLTAAVIGDTVVTSIGPSEVSQGESVTFEWLVAADPTVALVNGSDAVTVYDADYHLGSVNPQMRVSATSLSYNRRQEFHLNPEPKHLEEGMMSKDNDCSEEKLLCQRCRF